MRIAITGASGFIGSELVARLAQETGVELVGLTRSAAETPTIEWRVTDYSESSLVETLVGIDVVVHLAAVRGTTSNREDYVINEMITENILKAMIVDDVARIVFASTTSVYDDVAKIPWKEGDELSPRTMYGASKIECEKLIHYTARDNGFNYSIVRIAQVLGLGEKRRGMMNVFMDTAAEGGTINVTGKSEAKRQYVYVRDLVEVITRLTLQADPDVEYGKYEGDDAGFGQKYEDGDAGCGRALNRELEKSSICAPGDQIINVGMPNAYSVLEIAQLANKAWGNETPINYDDSVPEKVVPACMDISELRRVLNYEPMDMPEAFEDIKGKGAGK